MKIYPYYPKPVKNKISSFMTLFRKNRSWLDGLYTRSYTMKMGRVKMPNLDLYIPNQPDLIHRVLVSEAKYFTKSALLHEVLEPLLGESIFTTNGNIWKKQRELLAPSFEMMRIEQVFDLMHNAAEDMILRLSKLADGSYHNIDNEMTFVTADIIFRTILSKRLDEKRGKEILDAFVMYQEESAKLGMQKIFKISKFLQFFRGDTKRQKAGATIRNALSEIVKPRYEAMKKNEKEIHKDILSSLLKVIDKDTGKPFSFKEILDQIAMLFLAGHETTASSMTWTLYLLALYPKYQDEAYREIIRICGNNKLNIKNIKQLSFIMNTFNEALRLYPPVSFYPRETTRDIVMRDKEIKKGATLVISPWLMHRNELYWDDPHMFNPHRFDNPKNITKNTYFPFGMGPRICIGARFALQEAPLLLATILREYKLELEPGFIPDIVGRLTTRSINGMNIKLIKRNNN
jgi:cytochrome P450